MSEREYYLKEAEKLNIRFSRYWSTEKLKSEVTEAREAPANPSQSTPEPETELKTTQVDFLDDRMARYGKNPPCPACGAHPVIVTMRRVNYAAYRCRQCGKRWENDRRG